MEEWILSWLYQRTHSAVCASTSRNPATFRPRPAGLTHSVLYNPIVDSINALSSASPTVPIEPAMPASASCSVEVRAVYCEPASEWWTKPCAVNSLLARRRVDNAWASAEVTSSVVLLSDARHPRIRRE